MFFRGMYIDLLPLVGNGPKGSVLAPQINRSLCGTYRLLKNKA